MRKCSVSKSKLRHRRLAASRLEPGNFRKIFEDIFQLNVGSRPPGIRFRTQRASSNSPTAVATAFVPPVRRRHRSPVGPVVDPALITGLYMSRSWGGRSKNPSATTLLLAGSVILIGLLAWAGALPPDPEALVAFLNSLTGEIPKDALQLPVLPPSTEQTSKPDVS